jgi:hypothetical protein
MKRHLFLCLVVAALCASVVVSQARNQNQQVSFGKDVQPILKAYCLPCHAEENANPSDLSLDSYDAIMDGGKHGKAVVPRDPDKSLLIQKMKDGPPFGEKMPLSKKKDQAPRRTVTDEELRVIMEWIRQGAINN